MQMTIKCDNSPDTLTIHFFDHCVRIQHGTEARSIDWPEFDKLVSMASRYRAAMSAKVS